MNECKTGRALRLKFVKSGNKADLAAYNNHCDFCDVCETDPNERSTAFDGLRSWLDKVVEPKK